MHFTETVGDYLFRVLKANSQHLGIVPNVDMKILFGEGRARTVGISLDIKIC